MIRFTSGHAARKKMAVLWIVLSAAAFLHPCPSAAQLTIVPDSSIMRFDDLGLYRIGYAYRGKPPEMFPMGWSGDFDEKTGVACKPAGEQGGKSAFLLHPPWRGGTGITFQEFTFRLPAGRPAALEGSTALRADAVGKSDGVTFRIFVNGQKLLDTNRKDSAWQPFHYDLSRYAGRTVAIRFETDPGPRDDPSFDFALWGNRKLVIPGYHPAGQAARPQPLALDLRRLWSQQNGSVAPLAGFQEHNTVELQNGRALLRCSGPDGSLEYRWTLPTPGSPALLGGLSLHARMRGDAPVDVPLAGGSTVEWTGPAQPGASHWENATARSITLVRSFTVSGQPCALRIVGRMEGKSLVLDVSCDRPVISGIDGGAWGPVLRRKAVTVPYYSDQAYELPHENLFANAFLDWIHSNASSHDGMRASYEALTDGRRNILHERLIYTAAWHLEEVLPNIPNPPSPYRTAIAPNIVLDIWGGQFTDTARSLRNLGSFGIDHATVLEHVWQWDGYDNGLPQHLPPNAGQGGTEGMKTLVSTGLELGYRMALHENYIDYYPNYPHFKAEDIALSSDGKPQLAWFNPGTKIQSFAEKPTAIVPLAATQSPLIHAAFGTSADFIDVHSSVEPWFHVDYRASEDGAGTFHRVWQAHDDLWSFERRTHHGPVFGEGNHHWYWSGYLDGVEAQFGSGWPANQGRTAPLAVDFDLLRIHPLQFNHGMGYYERWWDRPTWGSLPPMQVLDQYRMQEAAYGHAGFLGGSAWSSVPDAWLESHLLTPVMERYATARPVSIRYQVGGDWVDGTAAAKAGDWRRVQVRYENGLTVTANDAQAPLTVAGIELPRFGWLADGAGVHAWTGRKDGAFADYAETSTALFASARSAADWLQSSVLRIRPEVSSFQQTGPRTFRATYRWSAEQPPPAGSSAFVHFTSPGGANEGIRFQNDHPLPAAQWQAGQPVLDGPFTIRIPEALPDGIYQWLIGLFQPGGSRLSLEGVDDGQSRIRLGQIEVSDGGKTLRFVPETGKGGDRLAIYRADLNPVARVINFGPVRTDGSVYAEHQAGGWKLLVYPRTRAFTVLLDSRRFGRPSNVRCTGGSSRTIKPRPKGRYWLLPLNGSTGYEWVAR